MAGLQIAAIGAAATSALVLGVADFDVLEAVSLGILWLIFSASVMLRSVPIRLTQTPTRYRTPHRTEARAPASKFWFRTD